MTEKNYKPFLYFNGDSFTEGAGLCDDEIFKEYPGHFKDNKTAVESNWVWTRDKILRAKGYDFHMSLINANKTKAYPAVIGKMANIDVYNNAVGGSNIFGILVRTVSDLTKFAIEGRIPEQVFIGLTGIDRLPIVNIELSFVHSGENREWIHTVMPKFIDMVDPKYKKYAEEYWKSHHDSQILTTYLYHCHSIKTIVKNITGKDPIFLRTSYYWENNKDIVSNSKLPVLQDIWEILNFSQIDNQESLVNIAWHDGITACGHFVPAGHIKYADYVFKNFIQKSS